ncbi:hypothetical protein EB354_18960 [Chryseobacterium balustinum]|nr:hypothetical protein EB354_18960 [Chryseobacterium balustinum]
MLNSPKYVQKTSQLKTQNMETSNHNSDTISKKDLFTIEWSDIENAEIDYENYLNDIENFFRDDFENDILEEEIETKI